MLTRTQQYAATIYDQVTAVADKDKDYKDKYGSMAHKLPVLIRTAGLPQALAFVEAKAAKETAWGQLLDHLAKTIGYDNRKALSDASRTNTSLTEYLHLTNKTLDALLWYKRFAQSVLDVEAGQETGEVR